MARRPCDIGLADTTACDALQHLYSSSGCRSQGSLLRSVCNSISRQPLPPTNPTSDKVTSRHVTETTGNDVLTSFLSSLSLIRSGRIAPGLTSGSPGFHGPGLRWWSQNYFPKRYFFLKSSSFTVSSTSIITYLRLRNMYLYKYHIFFWKRRVPRTGMNTNRRISGNRYMRCSIFTFLSPTVQ